MGADSRHGAARLRTARCAIGAPEAVVLPSAGGAVVHQTPAMERIRGLKAAGAAHLPADRVFDAAEPSSPAPRVPADVLEASGFTADTRRWSEEARPFLEHLPAAPTMFQEQIEGPADARVTIAGDAAFAARIETATGRSPVDSRFDLDVEHVAYELPREVRRKLLDLLDALGLVMGTVDLEITDRGEHVFLEVNPQGQFLYVEILTGQPITAAVVRLLEG